MGYDVVTIVAAIILTREAMASDPQDGAHLCSFIEEEGGEIPAPAPYIFLLAVNSSVPAVHGSRGDTICRVCRVSKEGFHLGGCPG